MFIASGRLIVPALCWERNQDVPLVWREALSGKKCYNHFAFLRREAN